MMKIVNSLLLIIFTANYLHSQNVGINTSKPHDSAILEVSSNTIPDQTTTEKRGFLPPRVNLTNRIDKTTIPSPAVGLLVYNTNNAGTYPNEVSTNTYYFWDGEKWEKLMNLATVEEAVKPRIFYTESNVKQILTSNDMNDTAGPLKNNVVTFESALINTNNFITFNSETSDFTATLSGIYEFSAFVNYNPMAGVNLTNINVNNRAFLNLKIQKSTDKGESWSDTIGSRTSWAEDGASHLKTVLLLGTPLSLNAGDRIRLVIANPFGSLANNNHCGEGDCYISNDLDNNIPVAKGLRIQLLDYNIH